MNGENEMAKQVAKPAPAVVELTEQQKVERFVEKYNKLCEQEGFRISCTPIWKLRDDSTFSLVLQYGVEKIVPPQ